MKVSLNWLKQFTDIDMPIDELVQRIGAQLGAVEEVVSLGERYEGIVIAKVVSCERHPGADKLYVCMLDDGGTVPNVARDTSGHVQVVCGAPNVRAELLVAWLPPGVMVPSTLDKDPLRLEARDIRGVVSNGMLASGRELAINEDHEGIVEIDELARPGEAFAAIYELDDHIIDIENKMFTHRPDCFGMLGVAREISGISHLPFTSPDWYALTAGQQAVHSTEALSVEVRVPQLCPRYMAAAVSGVQVRPSPLRIQSYLRRVGVRPVNTIVDMTNYLMLLTGQPLHAFDYDKVAIDGRATIIVRQPQQGETIKLLDGKTVKPRADAVLICNPERALAIGGVMGGADSEIDQQTTRIIIECANFDLYNIRRTSMEHGIFTDAVTRFTKGQSIRQCEPVIGRAIAMTKELCPGATYNNEMADAGVPAQPATPINVSAGFINDRLGLQLPAADMVQLLNNVECVTELEPDASGLTVSEPFWRTDLEIAEDIVEEVGRLYGYDRLPLRLPLRSIMPAGKDKTILLKDTIRERLSRAGGNELLTYSFVHGNLLDKTGQDRKLAYELNNALSPELQYYRMSLTPSLLDKVHANSKAGYDKFALFEINKIHLKGQTDQTEQGLPQEDNHLALIVAADRNTAAEQYPGAAYYMAKRYVEVLLPNVALTLTLLADFDLAGDEWANQMCAPYDPNRSAVLLYAGTVQGILGEFKPAVKRNLKLPDYCAGFELSIDLLGQAAGPEYRPLPRYPKVEQDISLRLPAGIGYGKLSKLLWDTTEQLKPPETLATLEPIDIYRRHDDPAHNQMTFRLKIASYERTLTSLEVNGLLDQVAAAAKERFGAERL